MVSEMARVAGIKMKVLSAAIAKILASIAFPLLTMLFFYICLAGPFFLAFSADFFGPLSNKYKLMLFIVGFLVFGEAVV